MKKRPKAPSAARGTAVAQTQSIVVAKDGDGDRVVVVDGVPIKCTKRGERAFMRYVTSNGRTCAFSSDGGLVIGSVGRVVEFSDRR